MNTSLWILTVILLVASHLITYWFNRKRVNNLKEAHRVEIQNVHHHAFTSGWNDGVRHGEGKERLRRALDDHDNSQ